MDMNAVADHVPVPDALDAEDTAQQFGRDGGVVRGIVQVAQPVAELQKSGTPRCAAFLL